MGHSIGASKGIEVTLMEWLGSLVAAVFLLYFPIAHMVLRALRCVYSESFRQFDHVVCLTFDDGPDPASTPTIIEVLRKQGVRATFFVLGRNAEKHPNIIAAIARDGHEIGEHGYSHRHPWKSMPWSYSRDLVAGHEVIDRLLGSDRRRRYRPTFGKVNALTFVFVWLFRKTFAFWNVDPHDYREQSESDIVRNVLNQIRETHGAAIVLLHDGRTAGWGRSAAMTAAAVGPICKELLREGYRFLTVGELSVGAQARQQQRHC